MRDSAGVAVIASTKIEIKLLKLLKLINKQRFTIKFLLANVDHTVKNANLSCEEQRRIT